MKRFFDSWWPLAMLIGILTVIVVSGCGGSGGETATVATIVATPIQANIELPSGAAGIDVQSLKAWSSGGEGTPSSGGNVEVTIFNGGPQYAELRDAGGHLVLGGFLSTDEKTFSAESTAQMLAFFAIGAFTLNSDSARIAALEGTSDLSGFNAVLTEVESSLQTKGYIDIDDASLRAALDALSDGALGNRGSRQSPSGRGTTISPNAYASGLTVDTRKDDEIKITNAYIRRCVAWLDTMSYKLENGTVVQASGQDQNRQSFRINSPKRYGGFTGTLGDLVSGDWPYEPVTVGPFKTPAITEGIENCVETTYRLTIGGAGASAGDKGQLSEVRKGELTAVQIEAFFLDYFVPFVSSVLIPFSGDKIDEFYDFAGSSGLLQDFISAASASPGVADLLAQGKFGEAVTTLVQTGAMSNSILPITFEIFLEYMQNSADPEVQSRVGPTLEKAKSLLLILGTVDKVMAAGETLLVGADFANSQQANVFTIVSTKGKLTLLRDKSTYRLDEIADVTAVVQNKNPEATYRYDWHVDDGFTLTDPTTGRSITGSAGGTLQSNSDVVKVRPEGNMPRTGKAYCTAWRIDGEPDVEIGSSSTTVTYIAETTATWLVIPEPQYNQVRVFIQVRKLEGDFFYLFETTVPKLRGVSGPPYYTFGPDTEVRSGAWRHGGEVQAGTVPYLQNGIYNWGATTLYRFGSTTMEELTAQVQEQWATKPIKCTVTAGN